MRSYIFLYIYTTVERMFISFHSMINITTITFFDTFLNLEGADKTCLPSLTEWRRKFLDVFHENNMVDELDKLENILDRKINRKRRRTL